MAARAHDEIARQRLKANSASRNARRAGCRFCLRLSHNYRPSRLQEEADSYEPF